MHPELPCGSALTFSFAAAPSVSSTRSFVSAGNPIITVTGSSFGSVASDIAVEFTGAVSGCLPGSLTVTDSQITCTGRITADPDQAAGAIAAQVRKSGGANTEGPVDVAYLVPRHALTNQPNRRFPVSGQTIAILGTNFPAQFQGYFSFQATLTAGSQTIACTQSTAAPVTHTSVACLLATPIQDTYRGALVANLTIVGYTATATIATVTDPPQINSTESRRIAGNSVSLRIAGTGLGNDTSSVQVTLSLSPASNTSKRAATVIACLPTSVDDLGVTCTPVAALIPNSFVDAIVSMFGGVADPVRIGTTGGSVVVNSSIDSQILAQNSDTVFVFGDGFAAGADAGFNLVTLTPGGNCNVQSASQTRITCKPSGSFGTSNNLKAAVSAYGAPEATGVIAQLIPTATITPSLSPLSLGSSGVAITGSNFDASSLNSTLVWLSLNNDQEFSCAVNFVNSSYISCSASSPFNTSGTLTGRVRAFYGNSTIANIGRVVEPTTGGGNSTSNALDPTAQTNTIIGVVVGVVAFVIIVAAIVIIIIRRRIQAVRNINGQVVDVPTEMAHLFSIVSSDLEIISKLGEGAYGAVFLGRYARLKCHVAIKKLTGSMMSQHVSDFFREAALMLSISPHPNVVRIHGMCQEQSNFSLVMEFLPNGALDSWAATNAESGSNAVDSALLFRFAHGTARGMAHLAASRVVHRDLAARNILLGSDYSPKVSDFGMSRVVSDENSREGQTNSTVGPIKWMSPESLRDRTYSEKSDVWSYGVLLFEILVGGAPYSKMELLEVAVQTRDQGLTPMAELKAEEATRNLQIPEYIKELMELCFKYSPEERPTFVEIAQFLEEHRPANSNYDTIPADENHTAKVNKKGKKEKTVVTQGTEPAYDPASRYGDSLEPTGPESPRSLAKN